GTRVESGGHEQVSAGWRPSPRTPVSARSTPAYSDSTSPAPSRTAPESVRRGLPRAPTAPGLTDRGDHRVDGLSARWVGHSRGPSEASRNLRRNGREVRSGTGAAVGGAAGGR